jgi:hypothetical protein
MHEMNPWMTVETSHVMPVRRVPKWSCDGEDCSAGSRKSCHFLKASLNIVYVLHRRRRKHQVKLIRNKIAPLDTFTVINYFLMMNRTSYGLNNVQAVHLGCAKPEEAGTVRAIVAADNQNFGIF